MKKALVSNSIFSMLSGLVLAILSQQIAQIFGVENAQYFIIIGICLILFSICVFWLATTEAFHPMLVKFVIALDVLWVIASIVIIFLNYFDFTQSGLIIMGVIALVIAVLAFLQHLGLKKLIEHRSLPEYIQMDD